MNKDVQDLLNHSKKEIDEISVSENISNIKVKIIFELLRSSLDYVAQDINSNFANPSKKYVYFPYGLTEENFIVSVKKNLKALKSELPRVYDLVESLQPHISKDNWLPLLCKASNKAKHNSSLSIKNIIEKNKTTQIKVGNFAFFEGNLKNSHVKFSGNTFNGKRLTDFEIKNDEYSILNQGDIDAEIKFKILENKRIIIADIECDCVEFIQKCYKNTHDFTIQLYNVLKK